MNGPSAAAQDNPSCFQFFFPTVEAQPGDTICLPLMVHHFDSISSMQFVVFWNTDELEYIDKDFSESALPNVLPHSFGPVTGNRLPFGWYTNTGIPVTLPGSAELFQVCFRVKAGASGMLPLQIGGNFPTIFEVIHQSANNSPISLPLSYLVGGVSTVPTGFGVEVTSTCVTDAGCTQAEGSASVEVSGGLPPYAFAWSGPNGFTASSASVSGLMPGLYTVVVTDQTGVPTLLQIEIKPRFNKTTFLQNNTSAYCGLSNGCAEIQVIGGLPPHTFEWSEGNSQNAQNCGLSAGPYTVTITDAAGCIAILPVEIGDDSLVNVPSQWVVIEECNGTAELDATPVNHPGPYTYQWSTGATTATVSGLTEGYYLVTVTYVRGGCSAIGEFLVIDGSTQSWVLNLETDCEDPGNSAIGSLILKMNPTANMAFPVLVAWSDGTTRLLSAPQDPGILDSLAGIPSGHYDVTVTDANGCHATIEKTLDCAGIPPVSGDYPWFYVQDDGLNPDSCAGVFAKNFEGVSSLRFSLAWTDFGAALHEIRNIQLPGLNQNNFEVQAGFMSVNWASINPVTLPQESMLFEVCLWPNGNPIADGLRFTEDPVLPELIAQGESKTFLGRNGEVFYQEYTQAAPIICQAEAFSADCSADGKSRILLESCPANTSFEGSFSHKDLLGNWHNYDDFSGLRFSDAGAYQIYAQQPGITYEQFFAFVPPTPAQPECVWPGDADNNNAVNHHDLLYIGLAFDTQGSQRAATDINWIGQDASDWLQTTAVRNVNFKNIDTNGDGQISAADTMAIVQNWGRVINPSVDNPFDAPLDSLGNGMFPNLTIDTDTLMPGVAVQLPLLLGSQENQLDSLYGLAFSISYDPTIVKDNIRFAPSTSWFGNESQFLWIQKNFVRQGRLDVAITRKDGVPVSGWGAIGNVFIIIEDNIFGLPGLPNDSLITSKLFFSEIRSTGHGESLNIIGAPPVDLLIQKESVAAQEPTSEKHSLALSPNPATESILIQSPTAFIQRVEISSAEGALHKTLIMSDASKQVMIDLHELPVGTYFARVFCGDEVVVKQFVVAR